MGTSTSRRMEESDSRSRSDDSSDVDSDLTTLLQYLIRRLDSADQRFHSILQETRGTAAIPITSSEHTTALSGQVHIISSDNEDSEDEFMAAASPPRTEVKPNTEQLDESEVSLVTKQSCGLIHPTGNKRPPSVPGMLSARENGMFGCNKFTQGDCCRISNWYLPNSMSVVARYRTKAFCGIYSKNGDHFVSASQDRNLRVYSTRGNEFKLLKVIQARDVGWSILDTALSPDGNYIVYSSWSESLHLCKVFSDSDSQDVLSLCPDDRRFCIFALLFSSDGHEILGGANDGYLYVYDLECNQRTLRIEGHDDDVNSVAFADNTSQIFYSGGDDGLCKVWDRRTLNESLPNPVGVLAGHMDGITYIDPRGDSRHLITNSKDQTIKLWDVRVFSNKSGQESTRKAVADQNWDYRWQKVPRKLANCKNNLEGDSSVMTYRGHKVLQTLVRCHFSPDFTTGQRFIYTGCASGRVVIYDVLTGEACGKLSGHHACVRDVSWHPYKQEIISTSWDTTLGRWTYSGEAAEDNVNDNDVSLPSVTPRRSERIAQLQRQQRSQICADKFTNTTSC